MHQQLLIDLNALRGRMARFRRVALHIHSPDSHDWGDRPHADSSANERTQFHGLSGLKKYAGELRRHVDFGAITDHMKCGYANQLCAHIGITNDFMVLPGMEVNLRLESPLSFARIHLLVILPETSSTEAFGRLFAGQTHIPSDAARTGQEEVRNLSLKEWVGRVHSENGICIAAHVENNQGLRYLFRQTAKHMLKLLCESDSSDVEKANDVPDDFKRYLLVSGINAIEIHSPAHSQHYRWISEYDGRRYSVPTTLTFDAHCIEDFCRPLNMTHVKMTSLGLQGLKEAFAFADTRIRYPGDVPDLPLPRILGLQISGNDSSFFKDLTVAVAENLNCIIGVRGSGKSTVVEALRYVFGYNRTLGEIDKLQGGIKELQKANLTGSLIRVAYRTSQGQDRVLSATFDPKSDYDTKVFTIDGDYLPVADVEGCGEFPLRLFGWSEIETLGRSPARQRDLLDRLVKGLKPLLLKRQSLRHDLQVNRAAVKKIMSELQAVLERNNGEIRRFAEYKADLEKLNTTEVKALFASLDLATSKRKVLALLSTNLSAKLDALTKTVASGILAGIDDLLSSDDALRKWWIEDESKALAVTAVALKTDQDLTQTINALRSFQERIAERTKVLDLELEGVNGQLQSQFAGDDSMQRIVDLRKNAAERLERATVLRNQYLLDWKNLATSLDQREAIANKLLEAQNEIGILREQQNTINEQTLNRFLPDWMKVSIDFRSGGDKEEFAKMLREVIVPRGNAQQPKRIRQILEAHLDPISFGKMCRVGDMVSLAGKASNLDGREVTFGEEEMAECVKATRPFEHDVAADVDVLTYEGKCLDAILKLQETAWDDYEAILLNGGPVNEKSPGQRSSAMLPLIALAETTPLVIDQPEDNLDKRLVGTVLQNVLAELKEKRQIIVCTHDPNILVGGDAEQVIVLEAESDRRATVKSHGSIDNPDIVATVVDLLEGGAAAFENRKRRYNLQPT